MTLVCVRTNCVNRSHMLSLLPIFLFIWKCNAKFVDFYSNYVQKHEFKLLFSMLGFRIQTCAIYCRILASKQTADSCANVRWQRVRVEIALAAHRDSAYAVYTRIDTVLATPSITVNFQQRIFCLVCVCVWYNNNIAQGNLLLCAC